ncbi:MAG: hypothetical protein KIT31_07295 [Deltaproteobacteria bacterium]|nr:hypothetical protein [Deltaproteobacteria bacterium]
MSNRTRHLVALVLVACASVSAGCARWSKQDTLLEAGFAAATMADWAQTRGIVSVCGEVNPLIGACGDVVPVHVYFPLAIVAHAAISAALPPRLRTAWQAIGIGAQVNQVWHNRSLGYGFDGTISVSGERLSRRR